ncbi:subclass B1 metallo-beta-lactamase, long type [Winogradskyella sp. R77965]|uniref:subclass B1 metallo-beta-lactamase, long type n=1 Tax=Winogradskyella sp. R77965 TaxID=3093872 RepID=UPI0037DC0E1A
MMRNLNLSFIFYLLVNVLLGQTEKVSKSLTLTKLSESIYIHTYKNNNGLIYIDNKEAIIISTPNSDLETQNLINWVKKKASIVGFVIDRWHPDAMEGIDIVHNNDIKTYSNELTRLIAKEKGLPIPDFGFNKKLELKVGNNILVCHYLGEAHTTDGIVAWIPKEKTLFAGNEIRNKNGWIGNIADANLSEWSNTAKRIRNNYGDAKIVIPGHGNYGGSELIDYTIDLYSFSKSVKCNYNFLSSDSLVKDSLDIFQFISDEKKQNLDKITYLNGKASFTKNDKEIEIYSDFIEYSPSKKSLYIPNGWISIKEENQTESFSFNKLYVNLRDDEVGLTLVIKEIK